jgi:hypothetical protein
MSVLRGIFPYQLYHPSCAANQKKDKIPTIHHFKNLHDILQKSLTFNFPNVPHSCAHTYNVRCALCLLQSHPVWFHHTDKFTSRQENLHIINYLIINTHNVLNTTNLLATDIYKQIVACFFPEVIGNTEIKTRIIWLYFREVCMQCSRFTLCAINCTYPYVTLLM